LVERGSDEEKYYREVHLENNTFDGGVDTGLFGGGGGGDRGDGQGEGAGNNRFGAGDDVRVIVVGIRDVRIADWKGAVRDWVIAEPGEETVVNGVR
jgi:hypothetical protein